MTVAQKISELYKWRANGLSIEFRCTCGSGDEGTKALMKHEGLKMKDIHRKRLHFWQASLFIFSHSYFVRALVNTMLSVNNVAARNLLATRLNRVF